MTQAVRTMDHAADLINLARELVGKTSLEIPAFSTLDRIAGHVRAQGNHHYFTQITSRMSKQECSDLDRVLDLATAIRKLMATGYMVTAQAIAELSAYIRWHIARYGEWTVAIADAPPPLDERTYAADLVDTLLRTGVA